MPFVDRSDRLQALIFKVVRIGSESFKDAGTVQAKSSAAVEVQRVRGSSSQLNLEINGEPMTVTKTIETKNTQFAQLESEIASRNADIENLREALATLEAGRPRPINPKADDAFSLLKELVGSAPESLEQQQVYQVKLEAARTSLKLATEICQQKTTELKTLREAMRLQEASQLVQELVAKAQKFNFAVDQAFDLLAEMKTLNGQISQLRGGGSVLRTSSVDLNEAPFCQISGESVSVRRRFDVKQEQRG